MNKLPLFGKTMNELTIICRDLGLPGFTAKQIADWLYKKDISTIEEMTNLSKKSRDLLANEYDIGLSKPVKVQESLDGTKKYLFAVDEMKFIEAAYIPENDRATLCVSSQVGCKMGCHFCMTGKQGFQGQLTAGEILNQIHSLPERDRLTNVVYMGMGEPLDNLDAVLKSIEIITSDWGYAWSPRRITVSTIGIIGAMKTFLQECEAHLAVSLHSPFSTERKSLMPVEQAHPLPDILQVIRDFDWGRQRRISFEYIMFKGVNDTPAHVKELVKLLGGFRTRLNLIRFHPIPDTPLEGTGEKRLMAFKEELNDRGIFTTIRASRGQDILAACGLLSTKELDAMK
ncbi:MAG: 23S rRNA (adenine(2503)-C(2))-methyltransferase RlmN [Bacteroidales bacterium]|nr:23S rRNA (adenine(2503)-C(2))-methyltransferase RlmN [Bacteroidales bacterium]